MPSMPHAVTKGTMFSLLEKFYSGLDEAGRREVLESYHAGGLVAPTLKATVAANPAIARGDAASPIPDSLRHINEDWFGLKPTPALGAEYVSGMPKGPRTGWWDAWYGDSQEILRKTMIRALEVSMGYPHTEPPPAAWPVADRLWPIQIFWVCMSPTFQGFVSWREASATGGLNDGPIGVVTVLFSTPGHNKGILNSPVGLVPTLVGPQPDQFSGGQAKQRGFWVVGYEEHAIVTGNANGTPWQSNPVSAGVFPALGQNDIVVHDLNNSLIVVIEPADVHGGVTQP